jgi:hypothetical protein
MGRTVLFCLVVSALLMVHTESDAQSQRTYYMTKVPVSPTKAPNACTAGFHFASLFEISEPSFFRYDTSLGWTQDDSGKGPPANGFAWIRSGGSTAAFPVKNPLSNCRLWTTEDRKIAGTAASLRVGNEKTTVWMRTGVWAVTGMSCSEKLPVWCVQD